MEGLEGLDDRALAIDELILAGAGAQLDAMAQGDATSRALTEACLARIERLDPQLNAFRIVLRDEALAAADAADRRRAAGERAPLLGVPLAIKEDVEQQGQLTTLGTASADRPSDVDSEVLKRLAAAGAVVVGRTNAPELLIFPFTESKTWGITRNPWDTERTPGGSSGGSAAAVASGMVGLALGSDGGGSIRIPATCCGLFGLKPTRDLIPVAPHSDADHGWQGLGVYGPIAKTVRDAALFMDATADPAGGQPTFAEAAATPPTALRIALATKPPLPGPVDKECVAATRRTGDVLRSLGHTVVEDSPRLLSALINFMPRYFKGIQLSAETIGNQDRFEPRTRGMVRIGRRIPVRIVARARRREADMAAKIGRFFDDVDVLLMPGLAAPAVPVGKWERRGALATFNAVGMWTPFTAPFNATGQPAAAVPAALNERGLPLGVQLAGARGQDRRLLSLAAQLEQAQPWANRRPPVS